jgi:1,4-dihydroxy-2-naphthoyl-CoA synthase
MQRYLQISFSISGKHPESAYLAFTTSLHLTSKRAFGATNAAFGATNATFGATNATFGATNGAFGVSPKTIFILCITY